MLACEGKDMADIFPAGEREDLRHSSHLVMAQRAQTTIFCFLVFAICDKTCNLRINCWHKCLCKATQGHLKQTKILAGNAKPRCLRTTVTLTLKLKSAVRILAQLQRKHQKTLQSVSDDDDV